MDNFGDILKNYTHYRSDKFVSINHNDICYPLLGVGPHRIKTFGA